MDDNKEEQVRKNSNTLKAAAIPAGALLGGAAGAKLAIKAVNAPLGNAAFNAAGSAMYNVQNIIKHPQGIIPNQTTMNSERSIESPAEINELKKEEKALKRKENIDKTKALAGSVIKSIIWKKYKWYIIGIGAGCFLIMLLIILLILGPNIGGMIDLTENWQ